MREMISRSWEGGAELERVLGPDRNNFERQSFCPKPALTCSIPLESSPMKNGYRKTYSSSAFVSRLTQNKNTSPQEFIFTADPTAKQEGRLKRQVEDSTNC